MKPFVFFASLLLFCVPLFAALQFTSAPSISQSSPGSWTISFALNDTSDVEVSIVDTAVGKIVRHLAAGRLGSNPPSPLAANTLSQNLTWDGLNDFGAAVINTANCCVRVRAGMNVTWDNALRPQDPCRFPFNPQGTTSLAYINGTLYAFGNSTGIFYGQLSPHTLRQFAVEGDSLRYLKTLFPYPANLQKSEVSPFGIMEQGNGLFSPKMNYLTCLGTGGDLFTDWQCRMQPIGIGGSILITLPLNMGQGSRLVTPNGAAGLGFNLVTSPAFPAGTSGPNMGGSVYLSSTPDSQYFYLSGIHGVTNGNPSDTGFWRDGGVYKVNRLTGAAARWLSLDSVPGPYADSVRKTNIQWYFAAIHGTCADANGRVFVCDRFHRRISVYNSSATLLDTISLPYADQVMVDDATNSIYVMTANAVGATPVYVIKKFSNWPTNRAPVWSKALPNLGYQNSIEMHPSMVVMPCDGKNLIAVAVHTILLYKDELNSLELVRDYGANRETIPDNLSIDKPLFVDRNKEVVYFGNSNSKLYKVLDWDNPKAYKCSTSAGKEIWALDAGISPDNNLMYALQAGATAGGNYFSGWLMRFTTDYKHVPANYINSGDNITQGYIEGRLGAGTVLGGIGVRPDNRVAVIPDKGSMGYDVTKMYLFPDSGCPACGNAQNADTLFELNTPWGGITACPKFDLKGNLYVGSATWPSSGSGTGFPFPDHTPPAGYENDVAYQMGKTCIARFPAETRSAITYDGSKLVASSGGYIYTKAVMMQSGPMTGFCNCRSSNFDVDYYGRLFIPNMVTGKITVLDNNDNVIKRFGQYGNYDSWGPESPVPTEDIPLFNPTAAAASDNYIYIADISNSRLVRTRMDYELNSMPGLFGTMAAADSAAGVFREAPLRLTATPNPFNPISRINVALGKRMSVNLTVFSADGRLVKKVASGDFNAGSHSFVWNGHDEQGRASATGVYLYHLTAGNRVITMRAVLAK